MSGIMWEGRERPAGGKPPYHESEDLPPVAFLSTGKEDLCPNGFTKTGYTVFVRTHSGVPGFVYFVRYWNIER